MGYSTRSTATDTALVTGDVTSDIILDGAIVNADVAAAAAIDATKLADGTVTNTELQYINSLSSNAQTQLTEKAPIADPTFTGTVTMPVGLTGIARMDSGIISVDADVTAEVAASSTTVAGKVEASIASEVNTGTDAARSVTPDSLAGSNLGIRYVPIQLNGTTALTTSEEYYFRVPAALTGMNLVSVSASVGTGAAGSSSSGTPTFTVTNVTDTSTMLSTSLTVDANEYTSATAAVAAVIDTGEDDVVTDDLIKVATTVAGTGVTYATVTLGFQLP